MFELTLASLVIMSASLIGVVFVWLRLGAIIERNLAFLVSFSAGVFLVITYKLGVESIEHSSSLGSGLASILAGVILVLLMFKFLPSFHHHHEEGVEPHTHSRVDARRILFSDALHNIGDGVLLASAFAVSSFLGLVTMINIFIHELVQEVSEFFVLRQAGYSTRRALVLNFSVSGTILLGALGGFFFLEQFENLEAILLGIASGSFLVVVFHDLIPHSVRNSRYEQVYIKHAVWFGIGVVIMTLINTLVGH